MNRDAVRYMIAACREESPREACGLIYATGPVEMINISQRASTFRVDPEELRDVLERLGDGWLGAWHSHPGDSEEPSATDWEGHPGGVLVIATHRRVIAYAEQS